jgi:plastocyanin
MRLALVVVALHVLAWTPPAGAAPDFGAIAGVVRLTTKVRGNPIPTAAYSPRGVERHQPPSTAEIHNVVVYLKGVDYRGPLAVQTREIAQDHEAFTPRVLAVTRGSTVTFPNEDPFYHNVFSLSGSAPFDLGRYPRGQARGRTFAKAGLVKVYCHIHSQMSASILVLDHPFFAMPADSGAFEIERVPPGRYAIVGWHERVGERTAAVRVEPGVTTSIELSLPVDEAP